MRSEKESAILLPHMPTIHPLPPQVVARIAAGEVIERPAYAVKELVENALDAGATRISISLTKAGLEKIIIHDNGSGMSPEDMEQSWLPHTTSKLRDISDLLSIASFGFRGEALHSIASVSKLTIKSRPADQASGRILEIHEGKKVSIKKTGMPIGTTMIVEDIFTNLPVRKSFLSSVATELRLTIDVVSALAIAYPECAIRFTNDSTVLFDLPKQEAFERVQSILGETAAASLLPVSYTAEETPFTLSGFIAKPLSQGNIGKRFLYVNKRHVSHAGLFQEIKQAYGTLLEPRATPTAILFFKLPPSAADVNIHPRKEQVQFLQEEELVGTVVQAIRETLGTHNLVAYTPSEEVMELRDGGITTYAGQKLKQKVPHTGIAALQGLSPDAPILQVHNLYLFVQTEKGVLIVDQHAAHERVLYEAYLNAFEEERMQQPVLLKKAVLFETGLAQADILHEHAEAFAELGFDIEPFGSTGFKVTSVPAVFQDRNVPQLMEELISDLSKGKSLNEPDGKTRRMLYFLACRSAIKAGEYLTTEQARTLIQQLSETETPYVCPHGRPTQVVFTMRDLEKLFHRKK